MKQTVFLIYVIIAVTTTACLGQDRPDMIKDSKWGENVKNDIVNRLNLTQTDINTCLENTYVNMNDLITFSQITFSEREAETNFTLAVGCFLACMGEKRGIMSGSRINLDEFKRWGEPNIMDKHGPEIQEEFSQLLNNCGDAVKSKDEKCEVAFEFMTCVLKGTKDISLRKIPRIDEH